MCPRGISLVMSDAHMSHFYQGGEKGAEKAKAIGSLPPHTTVITAQKALHVCLVSLKHCFMAHFTWAVNFHKWVVTYIQGRSLAACFRECALAAFQIKPEILSISFPGSSPSGFLGTGFTAEHLHGKVTAKRRVGMNFCGSLKHYSDRSYKNIAYHEHKSMVS